VGLRQPRRSRDRERRLVQPAGALHRQSAQPGGGERGGGDAARRSSAMTAHLDRRRFVGGLCCPCSALALAACAESEGRIAPGYKPLTATDEGGLWHIVQKSEEELKSSRFRV